MGTGLAGTFREVLEYAREQLGPAVKSIWNSIGKFINDKQVQDAFEQRIGPPLRKAGEIVGKYFLASMFGPAVIGATLRGVGTLLTTVLGAFITKAAVKSAGTATAEAVGPVLRSLFTLAGAAKAVLAAVVALTVGFSLIPERTAQFVRKAMEMFNGLGDKIGFLLGRLILGIGFLIKTAWNLVVMALTNPATILTYITKFGIAVLQAIGSLGALILSAVTGLFAGLAEGLGFKAKADEMRREFTKWKADFTESLGALPGIIQLVIDDIGNYLNSAFPRISRVFGIIGGYATRLRNALSIGRNEPPTLINNIETASRRAAATSNNTTQQVVANAQRAQQASQTAQAAAQTAQRATQTAQNATQGVANAAQPNAPSAEARMINPEDFRRSMTQVQTVVSELTTFAATAFRDFTPQQSETVRRGVQTVAQLLEAIKIIPEIANSIGGSGNSGNVYTAISSIVGRNGIASFLFDTSAHGEAQSLLNLVKSGGFIDQFVQAMPRNITQSVAKIASVFTALKSITDLVGSLGSGGGEANQGNVYSRFIGPLIGPNGVLPMLFDFNNSPSAVKFQEMFMRGGSIEQFANSLPDDYRNVNRRLGSVSSVIGTVNQIVARVAENTERVSTTFTTNSLVTASATFRANYVGQIDKLVTDFNRATAQLTQLNVGNVDITLDRIGDTLSRERTVRLEAAAASVNVNVNVKIDAADVQQALFEYSSSPRARNVGGTIRPASFFPRTESTQ
jgi:methyl-accepting chemotaxis protein